MFLRSSDVSRSTAKSPWTLFVAICAVTVCGLMPTAHGQIPDAIAGFGFLDSGNAVNLDPSITTDGNGNWLVVYSANDTLGGTIGTDPDILFAASTDNGTTWSSPAALNTNADVDAAADINPQATNNGAQWLVVWTTGGTTNVATSVGNSLFTWNDPVALFAGTEPAAALDGAGDSVVVAESGGNIIASHSTAGNSTVAPGANPDVATDNLGNWLAAFESGADIGLAVTSDGSTWSVPVIVGSADVDAGPKVAYDGTNVWFVFFASADGNIYMAVSDDNGATWSTIASVGGGAGLDAELDITTDENGTWVITWQSNDQIVWVGSVNNGLTFTAPAAVSLATQSLSVTGAATRALARNIPGGLSSHPTVGTDGSGLFLIISEVQAALGGASGLNFGGNSPLIPGGGGDGDNNGPCFIASAAYGTPMAEEINVLRGIRDSYLMNNAAGLFLVDAYYQISPSVADAVAQYPWMASVVRALLVPVLMLSEVFMLAPQTFLLLGLFGVAMMARGIVRRRTA